MMDIFYGEETCTATKGSGQLCTNKAYYLAESNLLCGVHSKKYKNRITLPKNPDKGRLKEESIARDREKVEEVVEENRKNGRMGHVIVTKLRMMKEVETVDGYFKIFPNFKHGNRKDGYGCPELSPKYLGPVDHIMPNLPPAKNLENFHQFAKIFPFEVDVNNNILPEYMSVRINGYNDPTPHRHKYSKKKITKNSNERNPNIPLYSVYYDSSGKEHRFTYRECRYFYCKVYERLTRGSPILQYLKDLIRSGYNLQIVGYDGYDIDPNKSLLDYYYDTSSPFGHELVLYTLLVEEDYRNFPWNIEYERNKNIYEGVGIE